MHCCLLDEADYAGVMKPLALTSAIAMFAAYTFALTFRKPCRARRSAWALT
jgi:hypothetical protein